MPLCELNPLGVAGMTQTAPPGLGGQIASASFTMITLRLAFRSIGFVSTLILARVLRPDDFGLVGLATAVFGVFDLMTEMSMQAALIRMQDMDRRFMDTAWTMNICRGVVVGCLIALTAGMAADWMRDARVMPILWILAVIAAIQGFENIGMAHFRRDMMFRKIFEYQLYGKLASFVVTITGALVFRSYWALVAGIATSRIFMVWYGYVIQPYRPRLSLAAFGELFHFSKWFMATNLLAMIETYTATLLFSRIGGPTAVGLYQLSWQVGSLPTGEIAAPIREPIYAGYARALGNITTLRRHFVDGLALINMVVSPLSVGIALCADLACRLLLGPQWAAATELIRLCAFYALFDSFGHFTHNVFVVLNRQRRLVLTYAPSVVLRFGLAIWAGLTWGMAAAVWVLTITAFANAVIWTAALLPVLQMRWMEVLNALWRTAVSCIAMAAMLSTFTPLTTAGASTLLIAERLVVAIAVGASTYVTMQVLLWWLNGAGNGPEMRAWHYLRAQSHRLADLRTQRRRVQTP
jgi:O-antigen/teichoic acid export membrane protein